MKKQLIIIMLLFAALSSHSQSKNIVGSWVSVDTVHQIQFFIKADGTVAKRTATAGQDVWNQTPRNGTYTFKNGSLVLKWADKTTETIKVKFIENNAEFRLADKQGKLSKPNVFLRIVDEEVVPEN